MVISTSPLVETYHSTNCCLYVRNTKSDTYRAMGVRELWLIDNDTKEVELSNRNPVRAFCQSLPSRLYSGSPTTYQIFLLTHMGRVSSLKWPKVAKIVQIGF